jgi:trypsin
MPTGSNVLARFAVLACALAATSGLLAAAPAVAEEDPRIVGGTRASIGQYPWAVFLTTASGFQFCGGTLAARNKVVTAAHCADGRTPGSIRVVWLREDKYSSAGVTANVSRIWTHPSYQSATRGYDVAVLTLDRRLNSPVLPLASVADGALYRQGTNATILGWGTTSAGGPSSRYLLKAAVPVTSDLSCRNSYSQYTPAHMVCAGYPRGGVDTCQGDSGGPLVAGGKLIGVTSWGRGCALAGYPGVYARVASYYPVLRQQIMT